MDKVWIEIVKAIGGERSSGELDAIRGLLGGGSSEVASGAPPVVVLPGPTPGSVGRIAGVQPRTALARSDGDTVSTQEILQVAQPERALFDVQASGSVPEGDTPLIEGLSRLASGMEQLRLTAGMQVESMQANTDAVAQNTVAQASKGANTATSTLSKIFSPILQMSGVTPLVSGIMHLFGGGQQEAPPALTPYVAPQKIRYEGNVSSATPSQPAVQPQTSRESAGAGTQVQIQVQAMDSRSFLDHSDEIASAVREALLRSHPLNDLLNEE